MADIKEIEQFFTKKLQSAKKFKQQDEPNDLLTFVKRLQEAGISTRRFLKLDPLTKNPLKGISWIRNLHDVKDLPFYKYWGVCGIDKLLQLESDKKEMAAVIRKLFSSTLEVLTPRRKLWHFYFHLIEGEVAAKTLFLPDDNEGAGEIRTGNQYFVAPGTEIIYEDLKTGEKKRGKYKLIDRPLTKITAAEFMEKITPYLGKDQTQRITFEQMREGVPVGSRHAQGMKYATFLVGVQKFDAPTALIEMTRWNKLRGTPMKEHDLVRMIEAAISFVKSNPREKNLFFNISPEGGYSFEDWKASEEAIKPMSLANVEEILNATLKRDHESKLLVFLSMLMNYSGDDQQNILFNAPSATGKSYIGLEIAKLFPPEDVDKKGYTSPTSFFHVMGKRCTLDGELLENRSAYVEQKLEGWEKLHPQPQAQEYADKSREAIDSRKNLAAWKQKRKSEERKYKEEWNSIEKIYVVDLEKRILIFKDQPHDRVLQVLRSMLSHDEKVLEVDITDKTKEGGHRTKKIRVIGFPTVVFCSARFSLNEQERTRFWILSPDMSQGKLRESLKLQSTRLSNKAAFKAALEADEKRNVLKDRIRAIKMADVKNIIIPKELAANLLEWFTKDRDLTPRDQRDFPRLIDLVKAHTLFQLFSREKRDDAPVATDEDTEVAKQLLSKVMEANRLGLPPYVHKFYHESLEAAISDEGITREKFSQLYFSFFKSRVGEKTRKRIINLMSEAGLVEEKPDPDDRRKLKIYIPFKGIYKKSEKKEEVALYDNRLNKVEEAVCLVSEGPNRIKQLAAISKEHGFQINEVVSIWMKHQQLANKATDNNAIFIKKRVPMSNGHTLYEQIEKKFNERLHHYDWQTGRWKKANSTSRGQ